MNKELLLFFPFFRNEHLDKDVAKIPELLGRKYGFKPIVITLNNEQSGFKKESTDLNFHVTKRFAGLTLIFETLKRKPEIVMFFHIKTETFILAVLTKLLSKRTNIYIKGDINFTTPYGLNIFGKIGNTLRLFLMKWSYRILSNFSTISVENIFSVQYIENVIGKKALLIPNGYDGSKDVHIDFNKKSLDVITISRLGTPEKNTELFLLTAAWVLERRPDIRFIAIGPENQSPSWQENKNAILQKIKLPENVIFTGALYGKEKIQFFKKSRILLMTSRIEAFANVFTEVPYYGNYIVTTKVGSVEDVTANNTVGSIVKQDGRTNADMANELGGEILKHIDNIDDMKRAKNTLTKTFFTKK